jgi:hypothetical protein
MSDERDPSLAQFQTQVNSTRYREEQRLERRRQDMKNAEKEFGDRMKEGLRNPDIKRALSRDALKQYQSDDSGDQLRKLMTDNEGTLGFSDFEPSINVQDLKRKLWDRE